MAEKSGLFGRKEKLGDKKILRFNKKVIKY